ncbi:DUF4145 domain-containing protein [Tabrizicola sp.]|uniref:DUF4145 domain-containing protein n=1 Tax=Tabrizicola sp. TaxID=2005166 RepID=UPI00286BDEFE|nr:DUF4145 domain-containing protein [Tabrizicola sp.]
MGDLEKIGDFKKAYCGKCNGDRNCEIKGIHRESGSENGGDFDWSMAWYLLVCRGCDYTFAQSVATDSESYPDYYDYNNEHCRDYHEMIQTWPATSKRTRPDWFQHYRIEGHLVDTIALSSALNELYRALDAELLVLSSIGIRTAFDVASETLGIEPSLPFAKKLVELVASGKILTSQKEKLEILVEAGSASAHRGWQPDADQVDLQMDILEEFIYNCMVLPSRQKKKDDKIAELKKSVPQKPAKRTRRPKVANGSGNPST